MKKITLILFLCVSFGVNALFAADNTRYDIRYVKEHHLYKQGDAMNVVDIDVEWPEYLHGQVIDSLQGRLQDMLFRCRFAKWQDAKAQYLARYGTPVTGMLESIPDDDKFCYVTCQLREIGLWEDQFVSFQTHIDVVPEKNSTVKDEHKSEIITYDLRNHTFVTRDQILRMSRLVDNPTYSQLFSSLLLTYIPEPLTLKPTNITIGDNIGVGNNHLVIPFIAFGGDGDEYVSATAYVPLSSLKDVLTKDFQKRLAQEPIAGTVEWEDIEDDGTYATVDSIPEFLVDNVKTFVSQNVNLPAAWKLEGGGNVRMLLRYVVAEDRSIQDVSVMRPCSPCLDRELVRVIKLMPMKRAGMKDGKVVKTRLYQRLNLNILSENTDNM